MSRTAEEIAVEALQLPEGEKLKLARLLLDDSEAADPDLSSAWDDEIARRIAAIETGRVESILASDLLKEADARLAKR